MKKYTIVIAEEKETIQRLLNKAVNSKPLGREKIRDVNSVSNEDELNNILNPNDQTILLLSTTFSTRSHEDFIRDLLKQYSNLHILTLSHRYGDRSSIGYGAIESVDKPIRNPVLWEKLDRVMTILSERESRDPLGGKEHTESDEPVNRSKDVLIQTEVIVEPPLIEKAEDIVIVDTPVRTPLNRNNIVVIEDGDDDYEDDMFESSKNVKKKRSVVDVPKDPILNQSQEELKKTPTGIEQKSGMNKTDEVIPFNKPTDEKPADKEVEQTEGSEISENKDVGTIDEENSLPSFDFEEDEKELTQPQTDSKVELPEVDFEEDTETTNDVDKPTILEEQEEELENKQDFFEQVTHEEPTITPLEQPKTSLEPISDIKAETSIYNEESEWTLAKEGFTTSKGDFVPLFAPRALMNKHVSSTRRIVRQASPVESTDESVGLFSSVRKLFKKSR
ncbi:hypothetical protein [Rossellomorea marisflavi]|uniref:hypothetical protein n=1 Tax=Rossellomorea marisflavi TaxID=189381 RepID=UPI003F9EE70B